jgi:hypothetical protein
LGCSPGCLGRVAGDCLDGLIALDLENALAGCPRRVQCTKTTCGLQRRIPDSKNHTDMAGEVRELLLENMLQAAEPNHQPAEARPGPARWSGISEMRCPSSAIGLEAWPLKRSLFDVSVGPMLHTSQQHGCSRPWIGPIAEEPRPRGFLHDGWMETTIQPTVDIPHPLLTQYHSTPYLIRSN